jgi:5-formyltetrahydrofolate cyclo-ligase
VNKDIARKTFLKKRQGLPNSVFDEDSSQLIIKIIELINESKPQCIHCFLPILSKGEINTMPVIEYCWQSNINVLVPISNFTDGTLKNAEFTATTKTQEIKNNIIEPINPVWKSNAMIDLVITPLLAFASLDMNIKRVGISLFDPCEDIEDMNELDIPLTHCVTPRQTYAF